MEKDVKLNPKDDGIILVKKLSAFLRGITSKHHGDFYCLNCFHSFATENKHESHNKGCENKDFCNIVMPSVKIIKNNSENSLTTKVGEHIPLCFLMSARS